jgi:hypothetical protein
MLESRSGDGFLCMGIRCVDDLLESGGFIGIDVVAAWSCRVLWY